MANLYGIQVYSEKHDKKVMISQSIANEYLFIE